MSSDVRKILTDRYVSEEKVSSIIKRIQLLSLSTELGHPCITFAYSREMYELVDLGIAERKEIEFIFGHKIYSYTLTEKGKEIAEEFKTFKG